MKTVSAFLDRDEKPVAASVGIDRLVQKEAVEVPKQDAHVILFGPADPTRGC